MLLLWVSPYVCVQSVMYISYVYTCWSLVCACVVFFFFFFFPRVSVTMLNIAYQSCDTGSFFFLLFSFFFFFFFSFYYFSFSFFKLWYVWGEAQQAVTGGANCCHFMPSILPLQAEVLMVVIWFLQMFYTC